MPNWVKMGIIILVILVVIKHPHIINQLANALTTIVNDLGGSH